MFKYVNKQIILLNILRLPSRYLVAVSSVKSGRNSYLVTGVMSVLSSLALRLARCSFISSLMESLLRQGDFAALPAPWLALRFLDGIVDGHAVARKENVIIDVIDEVRKD